MWPVLVFNVALPFRFSVLMFTVLPKVDVTTLTKYIYTLFISFDETVFSMTTTFFSRFEKSKIRWPDGKLQQDQKREKLF